MSNNVNDRRLPIQTPPMRTPANVDPMQDRQLRLLALAGPPFLAAVHVVLYAIHRAVAGTAPASVPGEFYSLVVLLAGLQIWLLRRGASLGLHAAALLISVVSLFVAPVVGFVLVVLMAAR